MKKASTILFWIGVLIHLAVTILALTDIWSPVDFIAQIINGSVSNDKALVIVTNVLDLGGLMVGVVIRVVYEKNNRILAGIISIALVSYTAIISGILLFVIYAQEKEAASIKNSDTKKEKEYLIQGEESPLKTSMFPKKMDGFLLMAHSLLDSVKAERITEEEYNKKIEDIVKHVNEYQDELNFRGENLRSMLSNNTISQSQYDTCLSEINSERARVYEFLKTHN